jgi:hypothetical protein
LPRFLSAHIFWRRIPAWLVTRARTSIAHRSPGGMRIFTDHQPEPYLLSREARIGAARLLTGIPQVTTFATVWPGPSRVIDETLLALRPRVG